LIDLLVFNSVVLQISFRSYAMVLYQLCECMVLYSHKKNVLDFLEQLCSLYQQKYLLSSAVEADSIQAFIDKVCELAEANGLPSDGYRSALPEFSADEVRRHLSKVLLVT